jgi:hypothetical protein
VNNQSVAGRLDEGQGPQAFEAIYRSQVRKHAAEERHGDAAHHRGRLEREPSERIRHFVQIQARQLLDDPLQGDRIG